MRLSSTLVIASLGLARLATAQIKNDFSAYPQGSQQCLYQAADDSKCSGNTGTQMNQCLCTNQGNFIYNTAQCVGKNSPGDLKTVYATLQNNCAGTGVTISVSEAAFMAQASSVMTSSSATATRTATSTSTGTAQSDTTNTSTATPAPASGGDLTLGAKIGIGAGIGLGAVALFLAGFFIMSYRRRHPRGGLNGDGKYERTASPVAQQYTGGYSHAPPSVAGSHQLSDLSWKQNSGTAGSATMSPSVTGFYNARDESKNPAAGQPLLAELGGDVLFNPHGPPVELPGGGGVADHPQPQYGHGAQSPQGHAGYQQQTQGQQGHPGYEAYKPQGSLSPPYERSNF